MPAQIRRRNETGSPDLDGRVIFSSMKASTPEAAVVEAVAQGVNLDFADLSCMNLAQKDLRGLRARHASFKRAQISGAALSDADLRGCVLDHAQLSGAHAHGALFDGASLNHANFSGSDISEASFKKAKGAGVNMALAIASRAKFDDVHFPGLQAMGSEIQESSWHRAMLVGAVFVSAQARLIGLQDVSAMGANFSKADLSNATLSGDFADTCFDGANIEGVRILEKANFDGATFEGAHGLWQEFIDRFGEKIACSTLPVEAPRRFRMT